jgi:ribosome-associated protein
MTLKKPAKKSASRKPAVKAKATSKKSKSAKSAPKKRPAKKIAAKKATGKKPVARKIAAKKAIARKPAAKKPVVRKAVAKKSVLPIKASAAKKPVRTAAPNPVKAKVTAPKPVKAVEAPKPELLAIIHTQLDDAKAEQITTVGLDGKSAIADFMVVASGRSSRHVGAIADQLVEKLKERGYRDLRIEGMPQCDWVLVDAGDVVVHLFRPEVRSFYNLEKLWSAHAPEERHAG